MNLYRFCKCLCVFVIVFSSFSDGAHARGQPTGIFFGNISSTCGNGSFGMMLTEEGRAYFLAHNISDGAGEYRDTLSLDEENVLSLPGIFGRQATARLSVRLTRAEGTIAGECAGVMSAKRVSHLGPARELGGLWIGTSDGKIYEPITVTGCTCVGFGCIIYGCQPATYTTSKVVGQYEGPLYILAAATGQAYLLFKSENPKAPNAGGAVTLRQCVELQYINLYCSTDPPESQIDCSNAVLPADNGLCWLEGPQANASVAGTFWPEQLQRPDLSLTAEGDLQTSNPVPFSGTWGSFSIAREVALPPPPRTSMPWLNLLLE